MACTRITGILIIERPAATHLEKLGGLVVSHVRPRNHHRAVLQERSKRVVCRWGQAVGGRQGNKVSSDQGGTQGRAPTCAAAAPGR